eukprot:1690402-Pyramimonas_sp.AAC.1
MSSTQDSPGSPRKTVHCGSPSTSSKSLRKDAVGWCGKGLGPRSTRIVCARACGPREASTT